MGRVRRGGYIFEWWIGDHPPRHIHVSSNDGKLLGRVNLETREAIDDWNPPQKVLQIIEDLEREGRV